MYRCMLHHKVLLLVTIASYPSYFDINTIEGFGSYDPKNELCEYISVRKLLSNNQIPTFAEECLHYRNYTHLLIVIPRQFVSLSSFRIYKLCHPVF